MVSQESLLSMPRAPLNINRSQQGASLVEILLAVAVFGLLVTAITGAVVYGQQSTALGAQRSQAAHIAAEGGEAVRAIRDENFSALAPGSYGLAVSANKWTLVATPDVVNSIFTRTVTIASIDAVTRSVTITVTWQQNPQRTGTVSIATWLTNWRVATTPPTAKGGMLVYANGGTTVDTLSFRILSGATGLWSTTATTADVDASSTNRAPRIVRVYSSKTRNEKILVSRHYNGTTQYLYAQVWNGTAWGNVQLLSSWNATTGLALENFDGAYREINGIFTVVYSDNTTIPKYRTWNGTSWSAQASVSSTALAGIPNFIVLKTRPATNEMMLAILDAASDTRTAYYSGTAWDTSFATRATTAQSAVTRLVDFAWSLNPLLGELVFSDKTNDRRPATILFTANGTGSVSAGAKVNVAANQPTSVGPFSISSRNGATEWQFCNKDSVVTTASAIRCYTIGATGNLSTAATISNVTAAGAQNTFNISYESQSSSNFLVNVYSDNTATPKLKKYNPVTATWDVAPTSLSALGAGILNSVRTIPDPSSNDIMFLTANANLDLWTTVWNGTTDSVYTTPAGQAFSAHGVNGSATSEFWYDYAWDRF